MKIGVVFPQIEIGADPVAVRDFAQAAEDLGYDHLAIFEHVLGANSRSRPDWGGPYDHTDLFHEPFVLVGYLAGLTSTIELATGVLVLPQRQTALVAKQAAAADVLSGGRLRLGIGVGWNHVEFEALGEEFNDRGPRVEEQIEVLRLLWTQELVTYDGLWHNITDAGINPLPAQRPIPLWIGGGARRVLERIGRLADGWFPNSSPRMGAVGKATPFRADESGRAKVAIIREHALKAGRDPSAIGIECRIELAGRDPADAAREIEAWREVGATHIQLTTLRAGFDTLDAHIDAMRRFKEAAG